MPLTRVGFIRKMLFHFFQVGLKSRAFYDFSTHGGMWCVGFDQDGRDDVDRVDTRSTRSKDQARGLNRE